MRTLTITMAACLAMTWLTGCDTAPRTRPGGDTARADASDTTPADNDGDDSSTEATGDASASDTGDAGSGTASTNARDANDAMTDYDTETTSAVTNTGGKGEGYGGGIITTPVSAYFKVRGRLSWIPIIQAMNLYKATNGSLPKDMDEFVTGVLEPNNLGLPELEHDEHYEYDAEKAAKISTVDWTPDNFPINVVRDRGQ